MQTHRLLAHAFMESEPRDAALVLERLPVEDRVAMLEDAPPGPVATVVAAMVTPAAAEGLARMNPARAGDLVSRLPLDTAAALLRWMSPDERASLWRALPPAAAAPLEAILRYPEGTAGALMDSRVLSLPADLTAAEALARLRQSARHALYYLFVVDRDGILVGVLNLRELMLASPLATLGSVMHADVARLSARADHQSVLAHPAWRTLHALPVVDERGAFVGAIRYGTLHRLAAETAGARDRQTVSTLVSIGEVCWAAMAGIVTEVSKAMGPAAPSSGPPAGDRS